MKRLSAPFGTTLLILLAAASQVRADYLNWSYTATASVPGISVGANSAAGGASVVLTDYNTPQPGAASIPVQAYLTQTSVTTPLSFTGTSPFSLAVKITDNTTQQSETLTFTGSLSGSLSATSSSVVASFDPMSLTTPTPLNGYNYTVSIPSLSLASPTSPQLNLYATVTETPVGNPGGNPGGTGGGVQGVPEPTSLLLGGLGFSCFGLSCWLKRRVRPAILTEAA